MKSNAMPSTVQMTEEIKQQLSQEVKETVATDAIKNQTEKFTASQMWNRHKQMRSASAMMRKWNLN